MTPVERKRFRALAHSLKPVVLIGHSGLGDPVIRAIEEALDHHELIKVRLQSERRDERHEQASQICERTGAEFVQLIGKIAVIYRKSPESDG
ncbi:MAG: ribosome assembly RNA-binding protein YhbY [Gammaproteobacteria bacterium]